MVTFVAASKQSGTDSIATLTKPVGVATGDVVLLVVIANGRTIETPTGATWTALINDAVANNLHLSVWWCWAESITGSSVSITFSGSAFYAATAAAYRGATTPTASVIHGTSSQVTAPSVSATSGDLLAAFFNFYGTVDLSAGPAGMTFRSETDTTKDANVVLYDQATGSGSTGQRTATLTAAPWSQNGVSVVVPADNVAPNAPILTAPADGSLIDRNSTQRFDWDFSDPDAGDSQSKYDLRYRLVGAATWITVTQSVPNTYHDFAAGTFAAGDYEWQVRTYDAQGVVGPYSSSRFFTAATAPETPTVTDPINGATVDSSHTAQWSTPDQDAYRIRRVADDGAGNPVTTTVYYDSGEVASVIARSHALTFETNNRYEHVQVQQKRDGLWSQWASVRVLVSFTPPPAPVVSLTADDASGALNVAIINPAPGTGQPPVTHNDVHVNDGDGEVRKATMVTPNTTWVYRLPKSGRDYAGDIRVVAVGDNGTTASTTA